MLQQTHINCLLTPFFRQTIGCEINVVYQKAINLYCSSNAIFTKYLQFYTVGCLISFFSRLQSSLWLYMHDKREVAQGKNFLQYRYLLFFSVLKPLVGWHGGEDGLILAFSNCHHAKEYFWSFFGVVVLFCCPNMKKKINFFFFLKVSSLFVNFGALIRMDDHTFVQELLLSPTKQQQVTPM